MTKITGILFAFFLVQISKFSEAEVLEIVGATGSGILKQAPASAVLANAWDKNNSTERTECYISQRGGSATFELKEKSKVESIHILTRSDKWYTATNGLKLEVCDTEADVSMQCKECGSVTKSILKAGDWVPVTCKAEGGNATTLEGNAIKASHAKRPITICEIQVNGPEDAPATEAPASEFVVGAVNEYGCWQKCNRNEVKAGSGRCDLCDGPEGQQGYCCRGDGYHSGCSSFLQLEMMKAGAVVGHACIYNSKDKVANVAVGTPFSAFVVGAGVGPGCWTKCDRNEVKSGSGRCDLCDGPEGQPGYCCRGDGYHSGCSSLLRSEMGKAGGNNGHSCIYNSKEEDPTALAQLSDFVVGAGVGPGCWTKCNRNEVKSGSGRCDLCDGPEGQPGYCCRGDGYHSGCSSLLRSEMGKAGGNNGHSCIYHSKDKVDNVVVPFTGFVVGSGVGSGCWTKCDQGWLKTGSGRCKLCDGPKGQPGYCCRGDGYHSGCSSLLRSEMGKAGGNNGHSCIYHSKEEDPNALVQPSDFVLGAETGCWGKCNRNEVKSGSGLCDLCDGPEGQKGYCCRGDGYHSGCSSLVQYAMLKAGAAEGHTCVYHSKVN